MSGVLIINNFYVGAFDNADYVKYPKLDFGAGALSFSAAVAVIDQYANQQIELRIDSLNGPVIGVLPVASTGGWENFVVQSVNFSKVTGIHDLYLIGRGLFGVANIDSFTFNSFQGTNPLSMSISSVSLANGNVDGGDGITITGSGFVAGAGVTIGGSSCTSLTVVSQTSITCTTPAGTAGAKDVVVTSGGNNATLTAGFNYNKKIFVYTGANQTFTVPTGVTTITVKAWGGAGGGAAYVSTGVGGGGGYSTGQIRTTPGEDLTVIGGGGGAGGGMIRRMFRINDCATVTLSPLRLTSFSFTMARPGE
jgi:hypothetical protein